MKNLFFTLVTITSLFGSAKAESGKVCDIEYPPPISYNHFYIDNYLFTASDINEYDSQGEWIDPACFKQYFIVTKAEKKSAPNGSTELIEEPWFMQENIWKISGYQNIVLNKKISGEKINYAAFTANTFGARSNYVLVFQTKPNFQEIAIINGYISSDTPGGFTISGDAPWPVAKTCEKLSMASYPQQTVLHSFSDSGYVSEITKEAVCSR
jgi:hypothetical protein